MGKGATGKPRGPYKAIGVARERAPIHELKDGKETGRFLARWVDGNGDERQAGIWRTKDAAKVATRAVVDAARSTTPVGSRAHAAGKQTAEMPAAGEAERDELAPLGTIADYGKVDDWPFRGKSAPRTTETHASRVRRAARYLRDEGEFSPFDLTLGDCLSAQDKMLIAGLAPGVVNGAFGSLAALARTLRDMDYNVPNPAARVRVKADDGRIRADKLEMESHHVVQREHLHRVLEIAPSALKPIFITPAVSSSRTGELLAANYRDWDGEREMMFFHETIRPSGVLQPWVKGRRRHRANKLRRGRWALWPRELQAMWLERAIPLDGYLVRSPRGHFWHHSNFYARCWKTTMAAAAKEGIPAFTIYDLRHTFATTLLDATVPKFVVAAWLGHDLSSNLAKGSSLDLGSQLESASTLMKHYAHLTDLWLPYGLSVVTALLLNEKMPSLSERPAGV